MNAKTKLSAKGQVVIPKDVRDSLGLKPGQTLEVVQTGGGVLLRPDRTRKSLSVDEATARIRSIVRYEGPTLSIEELSEAIRQASAEAVLRSDRESD